MPRDEDRAPALAPDALDVVAEIDRVVLDDGVVADVTIPALAVDRHAQEVAVGVEHVSLDALLVYVVPERGAQEAAGGVGVRAVDEAREARRAAEHRLEQRLGEPADRAESPGDGEVLEPRERAALVAPARLPRGGPVLSQAGG